jgi:hypothetical protein
MQLRGEGKDDNYGISRVDDEVYRTHAWRVSLRRHGKGHVKNFPDRKYGGQLRALHEARRYRDEFVCQNPPITRSEFCCIKRSNNTSGTSGVCTYAKRYERRDGSIKENWYWEASWPNAHGESIKKVFSVNNYGEEMAKQLAINARQLGLASLEGVFWPSERVLVVDRATPDAMPLYNVA